MLILTVGFFLRFFIERTLDIKVFIDYLSVGSIFYYLFMGYITLKLKNKLTLGNYITLIVIGGIIRIIFPYLPINTIIEIITKTIPEFLEILISAILGQKQVQSLTPGNITDSVLPNSYMKSQYTTSSHSDSNDSN